MKLSPYFTCGSCEKSAYDEDKQIIEIAGIASDVKIQVVTQEISEISEDWTAAQNVAFGSKWFIADAMYCYADKIDLSNLNTYAVGFQFVANASYRFVFDSNCLPGKIWVKVSNTLPAANQSANSDNGYLACDVKASTNLEDNKILLNYTNIPQKHGKYIFFGFSDFENVDSKNDTFVSLRDVSFISDSWDLTGINDGEPYFSDDDIISLSIIQEVDQDAERLPYNSYSVTVKDENDDFNPMMRENKANQLTKNQIFEIYSLVSDINTIPGEIAIPDYYITKVATCRLKDLSQNNATATFNFIGAVEYYDNQFLSESELMLSATLQETSVKKYLSELFGSNIDVSAFFDDDKMITPFSTESKAEIARIVAQVHAMYLYEDANGVIRFKRLSDRQYAMYDSAEVFKLQLEHQRSNPVYEKVNEEFDSVKVKVHKRRTDKAFSVELFKECIIEVYVKCFNDEITDTSLDDGSNMEGYRLFATFDGTDIYYDAEENQMNTNTNLETALNSVEGLRYMRIRFKFDKKCSKEDFTFSANKILLSDYMKNVIKSSSKMDWTAMSYDTLRTAYMLFDISRLGKYSQSGTAICEDFIDFWSTYNENGGSFYDITGFGGNTYSNKYQFYAALMLGIQALVRTVKGYYIATNESNYNYRPFGTANNEFVLDNPLVTNETQAKILAMNLHILKNRHIYEAESVWRGDCSLQVSDEVITALPIGRSSQKSFENYYSGTIIRNDIDFDGGLSETTVISLEPQKLYESNGDNAVIDGKYVNENVAIKLSDDFKFAMKSEITL